jgi:N-acetylglucosamine-6-phosphate deacetylase
MQKKCLYNGNLLLPSGIENHKAIYFDDKIIEIIDEEKLSESPYKDAILLDAKGAYISAGFIDIHIHGYKGCDTMDGSVSSLKKISKGLASGGVTSFLATTMSMPLEEVAKALQAIRRAQKEDFIGSQILGAHMEGPYLHPAFKGAQNEDFLLFPSEKAISFVKKYEDVIRIITLAPELPFGLDFIETIKAETSIRLSMGHTHATYEEATLAIEKGVSHVTHLFNAMPSLHHRTPGVVGAALSKPVTCELIADTLHVHPGLFPMISKAKEGQLILITDCMMAGGMPFGEYELGGQKVFVNEKGARLLEGNLAGSILHLNEAVKNMRKYTDLPIKTIIDMVTTTPAKLIGVDSQKGSLEIGKDADITLFNENIDILCTIGKGNILYEKVSNQ